MTASVTRLDVVKPALRWFPTVGAYTTAFLDRKASAGGPSFSELSIGPSSVLHEAQRVLGRCLPPTESGGRSTGLVVGYVQSGKTMSFETVIALARDNGYGLVIVLAGTKENLKEQSEDRLLKDLGMVDGSDDWLHFSNPTATSKEPVEKRVAAWKARPDRRSLLVTVLKHGTHIRNLSLLLNRIDLAGVPSLIIDDESDQASLNTYAARIRAGKVSSKTASTTYEQLLGLRDCLPHHAYLQYTATPQANLLLPYHDILNPDFAELVTPGASYTGGKAFFGNADLLEPIPPNDVPGDVPAAAPPKSLVKALRYFLLAAAQHSATYAKNSKDRNRSMMVHPAAETVTHKIYKGWVDRALVQLEQFVSNKVVADIGALARRFQDEYDSLAATFPEIAPLEDLLKKMVDDVFEELKVVEVNGTKDAEKKIKWPDARYWVLVGGAKLDRGYTVEGLCITYMPRPLGGSPAADTLQQRARFFGYKKSYLGLCRVYLQDTVSAAFKEYIDHEESVREELATHRGSPLSTWTRDFVLTQMLHPTRANVVGIQIQRIPVGDWMTPGVLHRDAAAISANRGILQSAVGAWVKEHSRVSADTLLEKSQAGPARHDAIEGVPLRKVVDDFLAPLVVKDPRDAEKQSAIVLTLKNLLVREPHLLADVFLMNRLTPDYRSRTDGRGVAKTHVYAPINNYFSQSAGTVNDKHYRTKGRIALQLRLFDLGTIARGGSAQADIKGVPWFALYIPESMKNSLVIEGRG